MIEQYVLDELKEIINAKNKALKEELQKNNSDAVDDKPIQQLKTYSGEQYGDDKSLIVDKINEIIEKINELENRDK